MEHTPIGIMVLRTDEEKAAWGRLVAAARLDGLIEAAETESLDKAVIPPA